MTITRERLTHFAKRQARWRRHPRFCQRALPRLRYFHREYAGSGGVKQKAEGNLPSAFYML